MWDPVDELKQLVYAIHQHFVPANTTFIAVHIRQGDKIGTEMEDLPISRWVDKLLEVQQNQSAPTTTVATTDTTTTITTVIKHQKHIVFVFSDNHNATSKFKKLLADRSGITAFTMDDAIRTLRLLPSSDLSALASSPKAVSLLQQRLQNWLIFNTNNTGYKHWDFYNLPKEEKIGRTKDFIASLTLAALADHAICTYSSNICRLLALLMRKKSGLEIVHSLDHPVWHSMK